MKTYLRNLLIPPAVVIILCWLCVFEIQSNPVRMPAQQPDSDTYNLAHTMDSISRTGTTDCMLPFLIWEEMLPAEKEVFKCEWLPVSETLYIRYYHGTLFYISVFPKNNIQHD